MECRYYRCAHAAGVDVSRGHSGLVQPLCGVLAALEYDGCGVLRDGLEEALAHGRPEIFNTDQGAQFTALAFTTRLEIAQVAISMDGRGRVFDNIFVERLWRTVKYEDIYLKDDRTVLAWRVA